ncbi:MAG: ArsR family transcriptional regulator [Leptolyngbya sp. PLA3]|nr:MAG: ArsR family transcriptional regulator [Cyanobacteria bacterium CYA]MCE7969363.1 ArsR family transcriptional regulator [Leptolyngbya sp. PL-A3]
MSPAPLPSPLSPKAAEQAASCLRTIAHPERLRIIELLLDDRRRSVSEIAQALCVAQPAVSTHLRIMRDRGLIRPERQGRAVFYRVAEPHLCDVMLCVRSRFACAAPRKRTRKAT